MTGQKTGLPLRKYWTTKQKCFYLSIYKSSPKTYRRLRASITLPSENTLRQTLGKIKLEPGISSLLLKVLQKKVEKMNREANHCLVFMVRGIARDWKMPIAFFPVNGTCPSDTLAVLLPKVILKLQEIGLNVLYTVSDQGPTNRGAISSLRGQTIEGEYDPVYYVGGSKIIHLYDSPHLIKSVRNNLITSDLQIKKNCLCPIGRNKMRVSLAAQVFSESVACGMKTFHTLSAGTKLGHTLPTIDTILFLDKLFDSINGPPCILGLIDNLTGLGLMFILW